MGSQGLTPSLPGRDHAFWSQLPVEVDIDEARAILGALTSHVCAVLDVERPSRLLKGDTTERTSSALASLDEAHCEPELLGATWEHLMQRVDRRTRGAHFTPPAVAAAIVENLMSVRSGGSSASTAAIPTIWDPSVGGGVFLLATARWLDENGWGTRAEIVAALHGTDIDEVAVDVCAAALEIWSRTPDAAHVAIGDSLLDHPANWPDRFSIVVGNPPFLSQLTTDTGRDVDRRRALVERFPSMAGGYVDESALFLALAAQRTAPGGVFSLVLPESVLGARDAQPVREMVDELAEMTSLWIDETQSFDAAVDVVAPVFQVRARDDRAPQRPTSILVGDRRVDHDAPPPTAGAWSPLLAAARGVPAVHLPATLDPLGSIAAVTAGFRQHFYGIADAVGEHRADSGSSRSHPRLITSGAIEPLDVRWGRKPTKFAGRRWSAPSLDIERIDDRDVRRWFEERAVPKVLLASQTRVLEAIVDDLAMMVPSVPVLSVEPHDPADVWRVAAVLSCPLASAWIARRAAGTGLSETAFRVRAREVMLLPLPADLGAWDNGADAAKRAQAASAVEQIDAYARALHELAVAMSAAYGGVDPSVTSWWWERLRLPEGTTYGAY